VKGVTCQQGAMNFDESWAHCHGPELMGGKGFNKSCSSTNLPVKENFLNIKDKKLETL
jgi:hypothetical protein